MGRRVEEGDRVRVGRPRFPTFNTPAVRFPWKLEVNANRGVEPSVRLMGAKAASAHPGEAARAV